jgi:hypothetical protein
MRVQNVVLAIFCFLFCFQASAITIPASFSSHLAFEDSTKGKSPILYTVPAKAKKVGFFGKLKNKAAALIFKRQMQAGDKPSTKAVLGWVSLGLILLSISLMVFGAGGAFIGWLFWGGLVTGLISLLIPRSQKEKAENKNSSKPALVAVAIGVGFVLGILILLSAIGWN